MTQIGENTTLQVKARQALDNIKPYTPGKPIWEVQQEYGLDRVVKLASNENSLGPSPKALQAIQERLGELHRYPDGLSAKLTHALAEEFGLASENFLVTNGGDELIVLISQAFLEQGDEIIVPDPTFSEYAFGANLMASTIVKVPLAEGFQYAADDLLAAVTEKTKIVYLCSPNNPTGTYLPEAELRKFLDRLPERVLVVIDVAYRHYVTAEDYCDGLEFIREGYPVIALHTFSKIYGLAGIRVGFGVAPLAVVNTLLKVKEPFNVNALAEAAATAALHDHAHIDASRRMNEEGREQLYQGFRKLSMSYTESMSNFVLVEIGEKAERIYQQLLERGIIVRYAKSWGFPNHFRISVGTREENEIFLRALEELV
ncbi:histidinol-phosphate transaminase [Paenibacillus rhizovicinus]|uniref:Histidinol-phosphate aminotransferase n=1 Tax=Paenibacillus rhizovicinus TaxID=2704463 RepID=A0A6C0P6H5_9BACL|nr:histidinol-phosphate transaminase [Paenibacillus rhizovicinus]QHW34035.1 histidinol-phosphate transaminase [Paenibacillus rhizovicinus]